MAKARKTHVDMDWEEEYDEETEYLIDDVLYYLEEDMPRGQVLRHLQKCDFDLDATVNRIFQIKEQKQRKKQKKKEAGLRRREEELRRKEEALQEREAALGKAPLEAAPAPPQEPRVPWPSSGAKAAPGEAAQLKRSSVNIESKRKESKRLLSNFKVDNADKSFWNHPYPRIEYPQ